MNLSSRLLFGLLLIIGELSAQIDLTGAGAPGDLLTIPTVSAIKFRFFWFGLTQSIADYSYEFADNELLVMINSGVDFKSRLRLSAVTAYRRSHEDRLIDLFGTQARSSPRPMRLTSTLKLINYPRRRISAGLSAGVWRLPIPRYWDQADCYCWFRVLEVILDKNMNLNNTCILFRMVQIPGNVKIVPERRFLCHCAFGYRKNINNKFSLIEEFSLDQDLPKYFNNKGKASVQNWQSLSVGIIYRLTPHLRVRSGILFGFRNSIILWPKSRSTFDLAKESVQIIWNK
jgi:hypothetical protein